VNNYYHAAKYGIEWWFVVVGASLSLLGAFPILTVMVGYHYLPTPAWVSEAYWFSSILGVYVGGVSLWTVQRNSKRNGGFGKGIKFALTLLFAPVLGFWLGSFAVTAGGPMIAAIIVGDQVEIQYQVLEANGRNDRRCSGPIKVDGMPYALDELCNFPESLRQKLTPGWFPDNGGGARNEVWCLSASG